MVIKGSKSLFILAIILPFFISSCGSFPGSSVVLIDARGKRYKLVMSEIEMLEGEDRVNVLKANTLKIRNKPIKIIIRESSQNENYFVARVNPEDLGEVVELLKTYNKITVDTAGRVRGFEVVLGHLSWQPGYYALIQQAKRGETPQVWHFEFEE